MLYCGKLTGKKPNIGLSMKIEHLLARHFYSAKQLTLQGIGTFTLSPDFVMPAETDKDASIPPGAITFTQNAKATEDAALIDFIVQQTRKMKPLASSDLESFLSLGSQFLNIGKPFRIDGIGVLEKNQLGEYLFTQHGQIISPKADDGPVHIKEKTEESVSFSTQDAPPAFNGKKIAAIAAILVVLGGIGWAAWYFLNNKKDNSTATENTVAPVSNPAPVAADTSKKDTAGISYKPAQDSVNPVPAAQQPQGPYTFKIVFKVTINKAAAQERMDVLTKRGHKVIMYTSDSVTYKLAEPYNLPLSDTAKVKDSLNRYYYLGKAKVEL